MKKHPSRIILLVAAVAVLSVVSISCSNPSADETKKCADSKNLRFIIVQNGLYPDSSYAGCSDTSINDLNPTFNYGNTGWLDVGFDSPNVYRSLIKFDLSTIALPAGAKVEKAYLSLYISGYPKGMSNSAFGLYKSASYWTEGTQNGSAGVTNWIYRWDAATDIAWSTPGGTFSDLMSNTLTPVSFKYLDFSLDPAYVQGLFASLSDGDTLMIKAVDETSPLISTVNFYSSEHFEAGRRPKLTIYYTIE